MTNENQVNAPLPVPNPERFVDAVVVGKFLSLSPRNVLNLARAGQLPGYPLGTGTRRVWRFRLSEVAAALQANAQAAPLVYGESDSSYASKPRQSAARRSLRRDTVSKGLAPGRAA